MCRGGIQRPREHIKREGTYGGTSGRTVATIALGAAFNHDLIREGKDWGGDREDSHKGEDGLDGELHLENALWSLK